MLLESSWKLTGGIELVSGFWCSHQVAGKLACMTGVTLILASIEQGDPHAAARLLPLVYDELRTLAAVRLSAEKPGQTLQAIALVHEAYFRLVDGDAAQHWNSRGHFFAAAAEAATALTPGRPRRVIKPMSAESVPPVPEKRSLHVAAVVD